MCGIIGYVGDKPCARILLDGLSKLEYRGYDSAGLAVADQGGIAILRAEGKLTKLAALLDAKPLAGSVGLGHTRWATHGRPTEQNAHPHKAGSVVVVHNGIIENHLPLREELEAEGRVFQSETDTEILAHLIHREMEKGVSFVPAVRAALQGVRGSYAVAVLCEGAPGVLVAARQSSPLVLGLGDGESFVASDVPAILNHTREVVFLEDGELAVLTRDGAALSTLMGKPVERAPRHITWSAAMAEKGGYKHFMLKEIHEQPRAVADTLRGRISLERGEVVLDGLVPDAEFLKDFERIVMVACGTSWHAALCGKFWMERLARIPVEVDLASEFRYRQPLVGPKTLLVAISQSGETADTLAAVNDAKKLGAQVVAICNVMESSLARAADWTVYTHAGPEIGVASTKAFVTQLSVLYLLAVAFARGAGTLDARTAAHRLVELIRVPVLIEDILQREGELRELARRYNHAAHFLFLGRWINYPIALEGALKLKEISYIHAEGYPAGEMKHGPIALVDEHLPVVTIATKNRVYEKILSNLEEAKARRGSIIALASEGDPDIARHADAVFRIPPVEEELEPLLTVIPLQLLAYFIADQNGTDVDQPRNLAKSVTVE